ncbi:hypothetical protein BJ944DRAFT_96292 [Cunninghamella echinulata]|nr:hypothetical protein BJ944DRAFT_96292 [Cunninghamella echinulata]
MSGLCIIGNYIFFFLLTPYLAHSDWIRRYFLPRTGQFLSISKVPIDELLFCVGFVTLFVFVLVHMFIDLLKVAQSWGLLIDRTSTGHTLEGTTETALVPTRLTFRLEGAQQRLSQLYPGMIIIIITIIIIIIWRYFVLLTIYFFYFILFYFRHI